MGKRIKRKYTMSKRMDAAYENYKKRYRAKAKAMKKRGLEMESPMMNKREYKMVRKAYVEQEGVKTNINQTIVSDQQYKYSEKTARHLKKWSKENKRADTKDLSIAEIRQGKGLPEELVKLNEELKGQGLSGKERQEYISYEVFGSE